MNQLQHSISVGDQAVKKISFCNKSGQCSQKCSRLIYSHAVVKPPSMQTNSTELEWLQDYSTIVPDTMTLSLDSPIKNKAEATSVRLLWSIMDSTGQLADYKNCISSAASYVQTLEASTEEKFNTWLDKAQVNIGCILEKEVEGRVSTEIDPRIASDKDALVARAKSVVSMYKEAGVASNRILVRIPGTYEGIQAAAALEAQGVEVHMIAVYSYAQAVLVANAGVSVMSINIGAIQDEYKSLPGLIKDPKGPREDSGCSSVVDPAIRLIQSIYAMLKQQKSKTQLLVAGIRTPEDAVTLAGCDYLVLSNKLIRTLAGNATLAGYNAGLSAEDIEGDLVPVMINDKIEDLPVRSLADISTSKEDFDEEISIAGKALLDKSLKRLKDDVTRARSYFNQTAQGNE